MQVITRLDVASESSGLGSCDISEGSDSPPLVSGPAFNHQHVTDTDFISRYLYNFHLDLLRCGIRIKDLALTLTLIKPKHTHLQFTIQNKFLSKLSM